MRFCQNLRITLLLIRCLMVFSCDCVPFRAGSASPSVKCFSACPVLVHRNCLHKVEVFSSDYVTVEFDLPVD